MSPTNDTLRTFLATAVAVVMIGLLLAAGCTSAPGANSPPTSAADATGSITATAANATGEPTAASVIPTSIASPGEVTIYAAASLKDAFTELKGTFEQAHPGVTVTFNFDGSQVLRTQLEKGATADVFASANRKQMDLAKAAGLMTNDSVQPFATNRLAVLVPRTNPAGIASFSDLANTGLRLAIGTKDVPIGDYARQVLNRSVNTTSYGPDFRAKVLGNVVSEETNVNALATKVVLGEVDAGIGYVSDVPAAQKEQVLLVEIPSDLNVVAEYPIGVLAQSEHPELAQAFSDLVRSPEGKAVLGRYGFGTV